MKKNNKKEESKLSPKKESQPKKLTSLSTSKKGAIQQKSDKFPKNANEFKHIMDDITCGVSDIEYMLQLRRNKNIQSISKEIAANSPSFYDADSQKYKTRNNKKVEEKELLKTNLGTFKYILSDRTNYAINDTQYKYEITLRYSTLFNPRKISRNNNINNLKNKIQWDPTTIPKTKSLFDTILPPVLDRSKELFSKYGNKIGRPIIRVSKDGYINGAKVKGRVYDYNKNIALRYPSEHYPSSRYQNDYGIQNIGSIRHLLDYDNKTMTSFWSTYLRGMKKIKYTMEDTKKREKRLRDKSLEKNYPKN
jgi:hypothetical protein